MLTMKVDRPRNLPLPNFLPKKIPEERKKRKKGRNGISLHLIARLLYPPQRIFIFYPLLKPQTAFKTMQNFPHLSCFFPKGLSASEPELLLSFSLSGCDG